jgi:hypothetical protein
MKTIDTIFIFFILLCVLIIVGMHIINTQYEERIHTLSSYYHNDSINKTKVITTLQQENIELQTQLFFVEEDLNETKARKPAIQYKYIKEYERSQVEWLAFTMANSKEYILDVYDCTEFSRDLANELKKLGYDAETILVTVDCDSGLFDKSTCRDYKNNHEIVRIVQYLEATKGTYYDPKDYKAIGIKK